MNWNDIWYIWQPKYPAAEGYRAYLVHRLRHRRFRNDYRVQVIYNLNLCRTAPRSDIRASMRWATVALLRRMGALRGHPASFEVEFRGK